MFCVLKASLDTKVDLACEGHDLDLVSEIGCSMFVLLHGLVGLDVLKTFLVDLGNLLLTSELHIRTVTLLGPLPIVLLKVGLHGARPNFLGFLDDLHQIKL